MPSRRRATTEEADPVKEAVFRKLTDEKPFRKGLHVITNCLGDGGDIIAARIRSVRYPRYDSSGERLIDPDGKPDRGQVVADNLVSADPDRRHTKYMDVFYNRTLLCSKPECERVIAAHKEHGKKAAKLEAKKIKAEQAARTSGVNGAAAQLPLIPAPTAPPSEVAKIIDAFKKLTPKQKQLALAGFWA
jgi:hypothetical protein